MDLPVRARQATVVDIAALVGVTPARIRQIIKAKEIQPTGIRWKAKLYDPNVFLKMAIGHHRPKSAKPATLSLTGDSAYPDPPPRV